MGSIVRSQKDTGSSGNIKYPPVVFSEDKGCQSSSLLSMYLERPDAKSTLVDSATQTKTECREDSHEQHKYDTQDTVCQAQTISFKDNSCQTEPSYQISPSYANTNEISFANCTENESLGLASNVEN